ncbi:hypothetical protein KO02_09020 [Sphingobacterium sp. ML3W]|uniref:hypothetical protein n=1 Tax=Sphingobacterium sp. ML3W TaxID=1538644 RepID=UPI0004F6425A|nr:hypothetical protein [Sphingobacterium sp. ML3W]AIM36827.1 hypothetical protein KO02_09020 [Sphingobacterium sp. ML3W]
MKKFYDVIFELIAKNETNSKIRMEKLTKVLGVGQRSVMNRMNGNTVLRGDEITQLMSNFGISWTEIAKVSGETCIDSSSYDYISLTKENFFYKLPRYLHLYQETLGNLLKMEDPWVKIVCSEVPMFHLFRFKQLTYFKLYIYYYQTFDTQLSFEEFRERVQLLCLDLSFEKVAQTYTQIKSEEIWDRNTFEKLLLLIKECQQYGKFNEQETIQQLWDEVDALATYLENCIESTRKNNLEAIEIYEFESTLREGFMVLGQGENAVKLCQKIFMIQSFISSDPELLADYSSSFAAQMDRSNYLFKSSRSKQITFAKHFKVLVDQYKDRIYY